MKSTPLTTVLSSKLFEAVVFCLIVLLTMVGSADAQQERDTVIDGCAKVQLAAVGEETQLTILVAPVASNHSFPSNKTTTTTTLQFTNCVIPNGTDIIIAVPPQPSSSKHGEPQHNVYIVVVNTTMQGGSLLIVPHLSNTPHDGDEAALQHIHVAVSHSGLRCDGDALVVRATTMVVDDVTMELQDVVLTSSIGSVVSIVTSGKGAAVSHCHIRIQGNSTMEAMYLVGSVQTNRLTNSSLLVVQPHCTVNCFFAPVHLSAGGESVNGNVGVLSIFPSITSDGSVLHLEDVAILVQCNTMMIHLAATASTGQAAVAGVSLRHPTNVHLTMAGLVTIEVLAGVSPQGLPLNHDFDAQHTDHQRQLTLAPTHGMRHQQEEDQQPITNTFAKPPSVNMSVTATVLHKFSTASVGGIALVAYSEGGRTAATIDIRSCILRLHTSSFSSDKDHTILLAATATGWDTATALLGIAVNSFSTYIGSSSTVTIDGGSSLKLMCHTSDGSRNVTLKVPSRGNRLAIALLGVAVNSFSHERLISRSSSTVTIDGASNLTIRSSCAGNNNHVTMLGPSGNYLATALLGIAVNCYAHNWGKISVRSAMRIAGRSNLKIGNSIQHSPDVTLLAPSTGGVLATALLGVAVNCNTGSTTHSSTTSSVLTVHHGSNLTIGSNIGGGNVNMLSSSRGSFVATALMGVALGSIAWSGSSSATVILDNRSCFTIASSASSTVTMLAPSTNERVATALLGIALNSGSHTSEAIKSTMTIGANSNLAMGITAAGRNVTMLAPSNREYLATALMGVALNSFIAGSSIKKGTSSVVVCCGCGVKIFVLGGKGTQASASVRHTAAAAAVAGVILNGGKDSLTVRTDSSCVAATNSTALDVWVGLQSQSQLSVGSPSANSGVVLGLVAQRFDGLDSQNTLLSLCIDNVTHPPSAFGGGEAVTMATNPQINGVEVSRIIGWSRDTDDADSERAAQLFSSNHTICSDRAAALVALLADSLPNSPHMHVGSLTPTRSTTHSRSAPSPTMSATSTLTFSAKRSTVAASQSRVTATPSLRVGRFAIFSASTTTTASETESQTTSLRTPFRSEPPTTMNNTITPQKRTVRITTSVLLPNNEAAATVVLSTAGASGAVASTLGSGGAGVVVTAGSSVRMMECGLAEDDPQPAKFELPIQFPVGTGMTRYFAGAALAHTLLQCIMLATPVLLRHIVAGARGQDSTNRIVQTSALVFCGAHPFFTPAILGACSTVLFNDDDALSLAVAGSSSLVVAVIHGVVALAVHRAPANGLVTRRLHCAGPVGGKAKLEFRVCQSSHTTSSSGNSSDDDRTMSADSLPSIKNTSFIFSAQATKDILLPLFDGCRHFERATHRHYSSIETTVYSVIAIVSGARPQQNCEAAAFAIGVLAALQLAYVVFVRPLRTRLDMIFSILNAGVLVVLSIVVAISLQRRGSSGDGVVANEAWVLKTVEVCLWLISVLGFVQLGVQGYWAYHVHQRRRHQEDVEDSSSSSSTSSENEEVDDQKAQPLLVPVEMRDLAAQKKLARVTTIDDDSASDEAYDNPLLDKEEPP